jgi:Hydrolase of X-linked nucleoside diphosphate N terminal
MILDAMPLLEQLKAIASLGLHYTKDVYDRARYEPLSSIAPNHHMI